MPARPFFSAFFLGLARIAKLGSAPFHFWYINILERMAWPLFFLLSTVQKVLPLIVARLFMRRVELIFFIFLSLWVGAVGIRSQLLLKRIIAYSSLFNLP
jgi:NADH-ubiquinone oxidoreductase chain 2